MAYVHHGTTGPSTFDTGCCFTLATPLEVQGSHKANRIPPGVYNTNSKRWWNDERVFILGYPDISKKILIVDFSTSKTSNLTFSLKMSTNFQKSLQFPGLLSYSKLQGGPRRCTSKLSIGLSRFIWSKQSHREDIPARSLSVERRVFDGFCERGPDSSFWVQVLFWGSDAGKTAGGWGSQKGGKTASRIGGGGEVGYHQANNHPTGAHPTGGLYPQ